MTTHGDSAVLDRPALLERHRTDLDPVTGSPRVAHIVPPSDGKTGPALVTEARIFGFQVEAYCGERFVPQYNSRGLPVCQPCKQAVADHFGDDSTDGIPDA